MMAARCSTCELSYGDCGDSAACGIEAPGTQLMNTTGFLIQWPTTVRLDRARWYGVGTLVDKRTKHKTISCSVEL